MLCDTGGLIAGTVGGGKVEAKALGLARDLIEQKAATRSVEWHLQKDVGMTCGGRVRLYFETFLASDWHIVIFGAGHVAQALIRTLLSLDCRITCVDPRADWLAQGTKLCRADDARPRDRFSGSARGDAPRRTFQVSWSNWQQKQAQDARD